MIKLFGWPVLVAICLVAATALLLWRWCFRYKCPVTYTAYLRKAYPPALPGTPKFAVIGAGFSGLGTMGALKRHHISFDCFEADSEVGGNWFHGVYPTVHIISSKKTTEYKDFPMPKDYPDFPSKDQMLAYLKSYAEHFKLREHIHFGMSVTGLRPAAGVSDGSAGWVLSFGDGSEKTYGGVIVCNGHHWDRRFAGPYPGTFTGEVIHSKQYKSPDQLKGKRVLVIGGGNSACDIAVEAARFSTQSHVSHRRGYWFMPRTLIGKPLVECIKPWMPLWFQRCLLYFALNIVIGKYTDHGLQVPDHLPFERHPTINGDMIEFVRKGRITAHPDIKKYDGQTVEFINGTRVEVDMVVHATGYHVSLPLLDSSIVRWTSPKAVKGDGEKSRKYPDLLQGMVPLRHRNLFVFGLGQPRYGAGPLITAGTESLAYLIRAQVGLKHPIGMSLRKAGIKPLSNYLMDPHVSFTLALSTRKSLWMLPYIERWFVSAPTPAATK